MEIQGDLVELDSSDRLPLPWPVRAHLGLKTNTSISLFVTRPKPGDGMVPDILVTPLSAHKLGCTYSVEIVVPEKLGAVKEILRRITPVANIVLSDTITLEGRSKHQINLVIEPAQERISPRRFKTAISAMLTKDGGLSKAKAQLSIKPVYTSLHQIALQDNLRISDAYITWSNWRQFFTENYPEDVVAFDLNRVVVSSNPDQRLLRYVLPRKNVIQLKAPHFNTPGALRAIATAISKTGYNILSSRLSRSPPGSNAPDTMSVFVAVCEPAARNKNPVPDELRDAVRALPSAYVTRGATTTGGQDGESTRYVIPVNSRRIETPPELTSHIEHVRKDANRGFGKPRSGVRPKKLIFLSYRFVARRTKLRAILDEHESTLGIIKEAVWNSGCQVVEAPQTASQNKPYEAIYSPLYAADACLVLALDEKGRGFPSPSQGHEYGFFMGQRKPVRLMVEAQRTSHVRSVFGNIDGLTLLSYSHLGGKMTDKASDEGLYAKVSAFVRECVANPKLVTV